MNPLEIATPEEQEILDEGEKNKSMRELERKQSLLKLPPSESESLNIHELFLKTLDEE